MAREPHAVSAQAFNATEPDRDAWSGGPFPREAGECWSPTLSSDGRHVAYLSDHSGTPKVWVQPVGSGPGSPVETGEHPVVAVQWSPDDDWLACQIAPGGGPRHEVWLVRPDGSDLRQVAGFGADTVDNMRWLPGRSLLAVTENLNTALLVDTVGDGQRVIAKGALIALLDVSLDGRRALLRHGPRGSRHIAVRDTQTGADEYVTSGEHGVFGTDGRTVYARSDGGELPVLIRALAGSIEVLAASDTAEVESFAVAPDGGTAAVLWNVHGGLSELVVLDLSSGAQQVVAIPGTLASDPAWSADGATLAFTAQGPGLPPGIWTFGDAGVRRVSGADAVPGAVHPELHRFTAHDGLEISGWLMRPADGADSKDPHPTVLWLHGGPEAQARPGYDPLFQSLVGRGIAVFAANVRGSSGFGRSFVNADNGPRRYDAIADVESCVTYLVAAGIADPARVGCMGRSYGGYLTLAALTTYPDLFAVGVDVCGMSDFATFYQYTEPWIASTATSKYGDPDSDSELLADLSPMTHIGRLRTPLLVVHGENDTNVPVIEAEQVVAALTRQGVEHKYLLFADEGHELLHRSSRARYERETVDWLTRYLVTPSAIPEAQQVGSGQGRDSLST